MAGREWKWNAIKKRRLAEFNGINVKSIPVNAEFWRAWKADKSAMRAAGVRLKKNNGQWQAYIEIRQ